ncbi:MAG: ketopantoate reductase family protein [Candidatus Omnitrophica bacterium]|nr:ketopantoate reductase family protein [Candidatus Omnitrophota bacterium]
MKTAVIGAGAIGSVVAAYLTKAGQDVTLIGRENQVKAISANGLKVKGARGEETIHVKALPRLDQEYDLVIFTVKTQDIESAVNTNQVFLRNALILSSQNGVQADLHLKESFRQENMFSSIVMFGSTYVQPGEVTFNFEGDWIIGKPFEPVDDKTEEIAKFLQTAFPVVVSEDIVGMKWLKLFVNFNNCIPALTGKSMQETFADMGLCRLSIILLAEGIKIIEKAGIAPVSLPKFPVERIVGLAQMPIDQAAGIINKTLTTLSKEPLYGSILQSIMRGRPSEIDYINGEIVRLARQLQIDAPLNEKVVGMVHHVENTGEYFTIKTVKEELNLNGAPRKRSVFRSIINFLKRS